MIKAEVWNRFNKDDIFYLAVQKINQVKIFVCYCSLILKYINTIEFMQDIIQVLSKTGFAFHI